MTFELFSLITLVIIEVLNISACYRKVQIAKSKYEKIHATTLAIITIILESLYIYMYLRYVNYE